jgi:Protein phosphatase 2C
MTVDEIMAGLIWKLELDYPGFDPQQAFQYEQAIQAYLHEHHCVDNLIAIIASALTTTELQILFNPHHQQSKSYTEAFSHWITLLDFVKREKTNVTSLINQQATTFILKNCIAANDSANPISPELILSHLRKKLYLWHEYLENSKDRQYLETCLNNHPDKLNQLIAEISKPIIAPELKLLLTAPMDSPQRIRAKQYWENLLHYIKTRYNPQIFEQLIHKTTTFIAKQSNNQSPNHTMIPEANGYPQSLWRWRPVSPGEENHPEWACQTETLPHGFKILAARVRGKKHKHEGTNCDDWFEIARSGEWGIIAVADGAGSKMFSRIGARVACQAASSYLVAQLREHHITNRDTWSTETFARNEVYQFKEPDIELTQNFLHEAMQVAYEAVEKAYYDRDNLKYYYKTLGNRDLTLSDFATTLLLAIHTIVTYKATQYSLVLTCQMGDGIAAAIYKNKAVTSVLGEIETNGFSNETQFLTSTKKQLAKDYLCTKTFPFFSPMRALMVMTDGVADDYFPPATGLLRLFGDMILNGIIPITDSAVLSQEEQDVIKAKQSDYVKVQEYLTEQGTRVTHISSVAKYAQLVNRTLEELIATPTRLAAGIPTEITSQLDLTPENRLQLWLETYHVRGSFDDRTLVILFDGQQTT